MKYKDLALVIYTVCLEFNEILMLLKIIHMVKHNYIHVYIYSVMIISMLC